MKDNLLKLIEMAIEEDIGSGDITTNAIVPDMLFFDAEIRAKEPLVLSGLDVAQLVYQTLDDQVAFYPLCENGQSVEKGVVLARLHGRARTLLTGERIALNFLQHLSGIATYTRQFVEKISHTAVVILDTRKTKPAYRALERDAVRMGDGVNHRTGLYDRYLIKNNHVDIAGSISEAISRVKTRRRPNLLLEVEARTLDEVAQIMEEGADVVLLDNFSIEMVKQASGLIAGRAKIEVSGNITLENVCIYAECGIDFISIGALTHSAPATDIHLRIMPGSSL